MLYIVRIRRLSSGTIVGYVARGTAVKHKRNATPYSSPSAADRAAKRYVATCWTGFGSRYYYEIGKDKK